MTSRWPKAFLTCINDSFAFLILNGQVLHTASSHKLKDPREKSSLDLLELSCWQASLWKRLDYRADTMLWHCHMKDPSGSHYTGSLLHSGSKLYPWSHTECVTVWECLSVSECICKRQHELSRICMWICVIMSLHAIVSKYLKPSCPPPPLPPCLSIQRFDSMK